MDRDEMSTVVSAQGRVPSSGTDAKPSGSLSLLLYGAILFIVSLLVTGYAVYVGKHALEIPLINTLNDKSLYPNDPFAATLPYYASVLWHVVAVGVRVVPIEVLFLCLFLMERAITILSAGYLARSFFPSSILPAVGAMAFFALAPTSLLGGGTIVEDYFEQTGFAIPFFMLAMAAFHRNKPMWWAVWLAVGINMNCMYGGYAITYFGFLFLIDANRRSEWKTWVKSSLVCAALASPAIGLTVMDMGRGAADNGAWLVGSRARFPHHLYPTTWSKAAYASFFALLAGLNVFTWHSKWNGSSFKKYAFGFAVVSVGWLALAVIASSLRQPALLVLQPGRATDIAVCLGVVALIAMLGRVAESSSKRSWLVASAFMMAVTSWHWHILWPVLAVLMGVGWVVKPVRSWIMEMGRLRRLAAVVCLLALFVGVRALAGRVSADGLKMAVYTTPDRELLDIAAWAKGNTSRDSVFLVNPSWDEFRGLSERPVYTTWVDGGAMLWYRPFAHEWVHRIDSLGLDLKKVQNSRYAHVVANNLYKDYDRMSQPEAARIARQYKLRYWVAPSNVRSDLPVVYRTDTYKVLDMGGLRR